MIPSYYLHGKAWDDCCAIIIVMITRPQRCNPTLRWDYNFTVIVVITLTWLTGQLKKCHLNRLLSLTFFATWGKIGLHW